MEKVKIILDDEFKKLIPPLQTSEYQTLEKSILNEGVREPIILWNDTIIDGHNRYEIATKHSLDFNTLSKVFKDRAEVLLWIINNQLGRRNLSNYNRTLLALRMEDIFKLIANENMKSGKTLDLNKSKVHVNDEIAKIAKVGYDTVSKVKFIEEKATDNQKEELSKGDATINKIFTEIKRKEKEDQRDETRKEDQLKVSKAKSPKEIFKTVKFSTIVIDPPWDWGDEGDINQMGRAKPDYNTMSIEELEKLPVGELTKPDAHIYLWITNRSLPKGFKLLEKWGFRYITCITWCKPSIGMGNYFRGSTEQVLFGVKGSLPLKRKDVGTWFKADRSKQHSSKPDEFYKLIESCSPGLYLDMFGRKKRTGWEIWGADSE